MAMNTEDSLREYLRLFVRIPLLGRIGPLARTFDFVADAAPGVKEILGVGKLCHEVRERTYDLIVVDAEATGHIVAQLGAPKVISDLVQVGLVRDQTGWMLDILCDPATTGVVVVTTPEEMPVTETLDLVGRLERETGVAPSTIVANRVQHRVFDDRQCDVFERLGTVASVEPMLVEAAGRAVRTVIEAARITERRAEVGAGHLERLRDGLPAGLDTDRRARAVHTGKWPPRGHAPRRGARRPDRRPLMPARDGAPGLDAMLAAKEMVLVCGSGGVGKTTTAAAMAATAATHLGGRVLVLTVDPARRLADALGIGALGNTATRVPDDGVRVGRRRATRRAVGRDARHQGGLGRAHPPPRTRRQGSRGGAGQPAVRQHHEPLRPQPRLPRDGAAPRAARVGRYDLIVVDTPPSRSALDVLDAPGRMKEFFESRLLRWLTVPYRSRLFTAASKPFYSVADRVLGSRFLQDIAEFFILFQAMEKRFVAHASAVERLLGDHRTTFVVVSTLEAAPAHEAAYLARALGQRDFHLGAIIANRVLPTEFTAKGAANSAKRLHAASGGELADRIAVEVDAPVEVVSSTLDAAASRFHDIALVATREAERQGRAREPRVARVDRSDARPRHQRRRRPARARRALPRVTR